MSKISQSEGLVLQIRTPSTIRPARIVAWKSSRWLQKCPRSVHVAG